ncbi:unnamed protein product [Durusdinium trenchii]|uniref:Uncharacterized protein n=1 Tax=Durusdinium trenchii TaxID=1381693 RepID=A0ABP0PYW9_9DINO
MSTGALPAGAIGPEPRPLETPIQHRSAKRRKVEAAEGAGPAPNTSAAQGASVEKPPNGITGTWQVQVQRPAVCFEYQLTQSDREEVQGYACHGNSHRSAVVGHVQGYVLTWTEDGHGKFRANLAADGQTFTGTAQLDATFSLEFKAHRGEIPEASQEFIVVVCEEESVKCPKSLIQEHLPSLLEHAVHANRPISSEKILQNCPLEPAAQRRLLVLLRALSHPQEVINPQNAVSVLSLADWLKCSNSMLKALASVLPASQVPEALKAAGSEENPTPKSVEWVLQQGLLICDTGAIEALAREKDRFGSLCQPSVLQCLRTLVQEDPDGLRLSRAAFAAITLGLPSKEVHAVLPSRLRFGPGAKNLFLDLHKRGIGPEGAARLEFPCLGLQELDLDLTRCNIRAVGAAALRFPPGLQRLRLILHKCDIGPEGAKALSLPGSLEHLELDLSHCLIGPVGAATLQLPRALRELDLVLLRCGIGARGAKALILPETLQRLRLDLAKCEVGPEGLRGLRLPPRISSLQLDLTMTALGLDSLKAFLLTLPKSLQVLEMNLTGCKVPVAQISNLEQVARQRLSNLTSVSFLA